MGFQLQFPQLVSWSQISAISSTMCFTEPRGFPQVPVLDVGDFSLPQSKAIERYVVTGTDFDKEIAENLVKLRTFFGFFF